MFLIPSYPFNHLVTPPPLTPLNDKVKLQRCHFVQFFNTPVDVL